MCGQKSYRIGHTRVYNVRRRTTRTTFHVNAQNLTKNARVRLGSTNNV